MSVIKVEVQFACDGDKPGCLIIKNMDASALNEVRRLLRLTGWTMANGKDYCPICKPPTLKTAP
jgi:hypothetical protein